MASLKRSICTNTNESKSGVTVDHASAVAAPTSNPIVLHSKHDVIFTDTDSTWLLADVDTSVVNWINADQVTHIV